MESASGATYLSKKYLQAYDEKRKKYIAKQAKKEATKVQSQQAVDNMVIQPKSQQKADEANAQPIVDAAQQQVANVEGQQQPLQQEQQLLGAAQEQPQQQLEKIAEKFKESNSSSGDDSDYDRNNRSCEEVHSDELEGDLNLSDCEDEARVRNVRGQRKMAKAAWKQAPARVFRQEIDTNIFKIGFKTLQDNAELATGDPTECQKCKAFFNVHSKVEEGKSADHEETQTWTCEFCNHANPVDIEEEEKPKNKAVNFILEAAAQIQDKKAQGQQDISIVFCIDRSGSMCVSQQVQGTHKIKGDKTGAMKDLMKFSDGSDQRLQGERNTTYVSRMQCLQAAIDQQITDMSNGASSRKLGIVAFNNEVTVYGDGAADPQSIAGDKLEDYDYLLANGKQQGQERMKLRVADSAKALQDKLLSMEETGPTALGPAVATAIAMAAEGAQGSQVVICTDGLANVGLGAFDEAKTDEEFAAIEKFYGDLGEYAKEVGLTINVISIAGDECNLDALAKLAEVTGGEVERVNPVELTSNFANILSQPIIASNVQCKIKLHKGLTFRNEDPDRLSEDLSLMTREIGNVTIDTEITFEYTMKKISELAKMQDLDLNQIKHFPFQVQITYKALDGNKCIRVITEQQPVSHDRDALERRANFNVIGTNAIQQSANIARTGNVRFAQANAKQWNRKMNKISKATHNDQQSSVQQNYNQNFHSVYQNMQKHEDKEQKSKGKSMPMSMPQQQQQKLAMPQVQNSKERRRQKRQDSGDSASESDSEDNAQQQQFGAGFNEQSNKLQKKEKKSKGGFFSNMFKKSSGAKDSNQAQNPRMEDAEMMNDFAQEDNMMMAMPNQQQFDAMANVQEVQQVHSSAFGKKGAVKAKRFHQDDELAADLFKAGKKKM